MRRRLWPRIALSLVLGVMLTLASAWVLPNITGRTLGVSHHTGLQPIRFDRPGMMFLERRELPELTRLTATRGRVLITDSQPDVKTPGDPGVPDWITAELLDRHSWYRTEEEQSGWPLRCFRSVTHTDMPIGPWTLSDGATSDARTLDVFGRTWTIRIRPMWPGLLGNLALWTACVLAVLVLPGLIRVLIRRARGRCTACGYDFAGTTNALCPECGADHTKRPKSPKSAAIGSPAADPQ
ncbi:MAG: hypothetical protein AAGB48_08600 [Planctomycetota bacterium]